MRGKTAVHLLPRPLSAKPYPYGCLMPHHTIEHDLDGSIEVWRYMSVEKFALFMSRRQLWFARGDLLGDEHEGSLPDSIIDERRQRIKNRRVTEILERGSRAGLKHAFVSCWSMQSPEDLSMWKIYTANAKDFAVKTTIKRLASCFVSRPNDLFDRYGVRIEKVRYIDFLSYEITEDNFDRFIHKQKAFSYEKEIRILISSLSTGVESRIGLGLDVDLDTIIEAVYVSQRNGDGLELFADDLLRDAGFKKDIIFPPFVRSPKY